MPLVESIAEKQDPRTWHWALMDYGVHIKKLHKNPARRSSSYVHQSKFEGSLRQVRGVILRELHTGSKPEQKLYSLIRANKRIVQKALAGLARDGLVAKEKGSARGGSALGRKWRIA